MLNHILINIFLLLVIYLSFYFLNKNLNYRLKENFDNDYILPKVVYCYWDNLETNNLIQAFINTWNRNLSSEWKIIVITKKNVLNYVDIDFYNKYKQLPAFRFSDFLRVYLLDKHGGIWIDSATILINNNFLDKYYKEMIQNKYDVLLYELSNHSLPNQPYLENWFIMAPKNSKFIKDLYKQFSKAYDIGFVNYKINVLSPEIDLRNTLKGNRTYLMQHAIIHYLLKYNKYNICIKDANESMFKAQKINDWECNKLVNYILTNNNWDDYYAIKLVGNNRKCIKDAESFINKLNSF
jgi:hypothetical protein